MSDSGRRCLDESPTAPSGERKEPVGAPSARQSGDSQLRFRSIPRKSGYGWRSANQGDSNGGAIANMRAHGSLMSGAIPFCKENVAHRLMRERDVFSGLEGMDQLLSLESILIP
jgi:hypothetical protein